MIGIDIVKVERIERAVISRHFTERVFTPIERDYYEEKGCRPETLAGIFCAKEAVAKALGSGISGFGFHDVEIGHTASGAPEVRLSGRAAELARGAKPHVSISHDGGVAVAICLLEESR